MTCKKKKSVTKVKTKKEKNWNQIMSNKISWKASATTHFSNEKIKRKEVQRT